MTDETKKTGAVDEGTRVQGRPPRPGLDAKGGQRALRDHAVETAANARERYGPEVDWPVFCEMLEDPTVVRFPTRVRFDAGPLQHGEFAHLEPAGDSPADGFHLIIHPRFRDRVEALPRIAAYYLVRVNYGSVATRVEAELFGATLLGLDVERYYEALVSLSDELSGEDAPP